MLEAEVQMQNDLKSADFQLASQIANLNRVLAQFRVFEHLQLLPVVPLGAVAQGICKTRFHGPVFSLIKYSDCFQAPKQMSPFW